MNRFMSLIFLCITTIYLPVQAQFGIPKQPNLQQQQTKDVSGTDSEELRTLTSKDAATIEALIKEAANDPEMLQMIRKVQLEMGEELVELSKLPQEDILGGMKECIDQIQLIDTYFREDPQNAVDEMNQSGLINPDDLEKFKADPDLLYQDTIKAIYFQFVTLAVVGGFLEVQFEEEEPVKMMM